MRKLTDIDKSCIFWGSLALTVWIHYILSGAMLIFLGIWAWVRRDTRRYILSNKTYFYTLIMLTGISLVSSAFSGNLPGLGVTFGIFLVLSVGGAARGMANEKAFDVFSVLCCFFCMGAIVAAFLQKMYYADGYRPTAGSMNANYFGALIVMTMCIACVKLFYGSPTVKGHVWYRPTRFFYALTLAFGVFGLLLSESRSSLMTVMAAFGMFLLLSGRYILLSVGAVGALAVWVVGWFRPDLFSWTNSLLYIFTERAVIWKDALSSFLHPEHNITLGRAFSMLFGRGPMTYFMVWAAEGLHEANHAHNLLVDSLINVGVIGTAMYAALAGYFVKIAAGLRRICRVDFYMLTMLLTAVAVQGFFDVTIMWHQSAVLFISVLGYSARERNSFST